MQKRKDIKGWRGKRRKKDCSYEKQNSLEILNTTSSNFPLFSFQENQFYQGSYI